MYRLLIVDDEPIVVDGLFDFFSQINDIDLEIYRAYSSISAFEILETIRMDIVLSDICMPQMDGLVFLKKIRSNWPRIRVIFLTGYDQFNYAQEALRNGAIDYILKTEGDESILQSVKNAIQQINDEINKDELIQKARSNMIRALPVLQKSFLKNILNGTMKYQDSDLDNELKQLQIFLDAYMPCKIMIIKIDDKNLVTSTVENANVEYQIEIIAQEYISNEIISFSFIYDQNKIVWLVQPNFKNMGEDENQDVAKMWNRASIFLQQTAEQIQKKCKSILDVSVTFIISNSQCYWNNMSESFYSLTLLSNKYAGVEKELILVDYNSYANIKNEENYGIRVKLQKVDLIQMYLESGQKDEFIYTLNVIFENIYETSYLYSLFTKEVYYRIARIFLCYINNLNLMENLVSKIDLNLLTEMELHISWKDIHEYFLKLGEIIFELKIENNHVNNNKIVSTIQSYVQANVGNDLSLTKFSELLHFNSSYISRMYKQYTNESISEYISKVKLQKAKELLEGRDLKINEITIFLGFGTASYFTRFFKKNTGLSPQDYREHFFH